MRDARRWVRRAALGSVTALALSLVGCGMGGMEQGAMMPRDQTAGGAHASRGLNAPLAVGATVRTTIALDMPGSGAPTMVLRSARPDIVRVQNNALTGVAPGVSAVLISTADGTVLDFTHIWVTEPTHLELHTYTPDGFDQGAATDRVELSVGEQVYLQPHAYAAAQELAGEADSTWQVKPSVAAILRCGVANRRRLVTTAPGRATVTVRTLGREATVELVVHGVDSAWPVRAAPAAPTAPVSRPGERPSPEPADPGRRDAGPDQGRKDPLVDPWKAGSTPPRQAPRPAGKPTIPIPGIPEPAPLRQRGPAEPGPLSEDM